MQLNSTIGLNSACVAAIMFVLVGCNSTDPTLGVEPSSNVTTPAASSATNTTDPNSVYFAPIVGAPVANVTALSRRLSAAATANNVKLEGSASTAARYEIKGYFSALSDAGATTIINVWDVFERGGQRVHRIQGEEKIVGTASDPWSIVPAATMEKIADNVLTQFAAWRATQ